jgi:hypothetical protein
LAHLSRELSDIHRASCMDNDSHSPPAAWSPAGGRPAAPLSCHAQCCRRCAQGRAPGPSRCRAGAS